MSSTTIQTTLGRLDSPEQFLLNNRCWVVKWAIKKIANRNSFLCRSNVIGIISRLLFVLVCSVKVADCRVARCRFGFIVATKKNNQKVASGMGKEILNAQSSQRVADNSLFDFPNSRC